MIGDDQEAFLEGTKRFGFFKVFLTSSSMQSQAI